MCGLVGFIRKSKLSSGVIESIVMSMANQLVHRGPDDAGVWSDDSIGIALAHRRLSILDLSQSGHQPMVSACSRYVVIFNGEIYNHLDLRKDLGDISWRGHSDTETLLAAISHWGFESTLQKCVGMFAIALWDKQTETLSLARDRFGEKPLYYGWIGEGEKKAFAFASELKALLAYPGFSNSICRVALAQYLRFMYVPAPLSIYQDIYKLEAGSILTMHASLRDGTSDVQTHRYWSLNDAVAIAKNNQIVDEETALIDLENSLTESVQIQSQADVPLGAFLSGGVDSSTIVALMQRNARLNGSGPVETFTVGSDVADYDESVYAREVARHLGTYHTELFVSSKQAIDVISKLPSIYDEPFADSSQIPTHLVCQAARKRVTVALSGDAGDELFGGYNRYFWGPRIWNKLAWAPFPLRRQLSSLIRTMPIAGWDSLSHLSGVSRLGDKAYKLAARLDTVHNMDDLYWSLVSEWPDTSKLVKNLDEKFSSDTNWPIPEGLDSVERMMFRDTLTYLSDDILCKVDRAAMACSLETRVPFLDHRVVELAWRLPQSMKVRGNTGKWALRQILYKYVPKELIERPKSGFGIPVGQWLRGPLREWAEALLNPGRLAREGYLHPELISKVWHEHLSGRHDWTARLWAVLMFQAWLESNTVN